MYKVKIYVAHGYYQYDVDTAEQAIAHAQVITSTGVYRRVDNNGDVEFHKPYKVKVCGKDLGSQYMDTFVST